MKFLIRLGALLQYLLAGLGPLALVHIDEFEDFGGLADGEATVLEKRPESRSLHFAATRLLENS